MAPCAARKRRCHWRGSHYLVVGLLVEVLLRSGNLSHHHLHHLLQRPPSRYVPCPSPFLMAETDDISSQSNPPPSFCCKEFPPRFLSNWSEQPSSASQECSTFTVSLPLPLRPDLPLIHLATPELHVWSLSESKTVASVHIMVKNKDDFVEVSKKIRKVMHRFGIHSSSVHSPFLPLSNFECLRMCADTIL